MRIIKARVEQVTKDGIIVMMSNGIKPLNLIVNKKDITFEDFKEKKCL